MPLRAKTICRRNGCSRAISEPGYCELHKQFTSGWAESSKASNTVRGYGWSWRQLRNSIITKHAGLCQVCLKQDRVTLATEVDHILSKANGGTDEDNNLQAICKTCHRIKTITDRKSVKK